MIVPDVNLLLHSYNTGSASHLAARSWWESTLSDTRPVGLTWVSILGFVRIATNRSIFERPLRPAQATAEVRGWLSAPNVQILVPGEAHGDILIGLLDHLGTAGNLTTDAHLAALAIEYHAEVASTDTDFARFPKVRWFNPIARPKRAN
jgi:toxin-antitoxin system PIN domain toxin